MQKSTVDWASTGQLALSLIGITFQLGLALLMFILGATQLIAVGCFFGLIFANRFLEKNSVRGAERQPDQPCMEGTIPGGFE